MSDDRERQPSIDYLYEYDSACARYELTRAVRLFAEGYTEIPTSLLSGDHEIYGLRRLLFSSEEIVAGKGK